jgi:hypothetical protein
MPSANSRTPFAAFSLARNCCSAASAFRFGGLRVSFALRFLLGKNLFDARVIQRQRLALIGLLEAIDQGLDLQVGNLLAQPLTQAGTQAVGEIVLSRAGVWAATVRSHGPPKSPGQAQEKGNATWAFSAESATDYASAKVKSAAFSLYR